MEGCYIEAYSIWRVVISRFTLNGGLSYRGLLYMEGCYTEVYVIWRVKEERGGGGVLLLLHRLI